MSRKRLEISRRSFVHGSLVLAGLNAVPAWAAADVPEEIEPQPYFASVSRAVADLARVGQPINEGDADQLQQLAAQGDTQAVSAAEQILDKYNLARVVIGTNGVGQAITGGADRLLLEQGWKSFLLRISNPTSITTSLAMFGGDTIGQMSQSNGEQVARVPDTLFPAPGIEEMWLLSEFTTDRRLSGASVEYKVVTLFSRNRGTNTARLVFGAENSGANACEIDGASPHHDPHSGFPRSSPWTQPLRTKTDRPIGR